MQTDSNITFEIKRDGTVSTMEFAYFKYKEVESVFCYENNRILPFPKNIAKMFCGLPLIGMEDIGLPFILNSLNLRHHKSVMALLYRLHQIQRIDNCLLIL